VKRREEGSAGKKNRFLTDQKSILGETRKRKIMLVTHLGELYRGTVCAGSKRRGRMRRGRGWKEEKNRKDVCRWRASLRRGATNTRKAYYSLPPGQERQERKAEEGD